MPKRIISKGFAIAAGAAMIFSLSACSTDSAFPEETVQGYFGPLAEAAPTAKEAALDFAAAGSVAEMYVIEQVAHTQALQDGGNLENVKQEVVVEGESVFLCDDGYDDKDADMADFCAEYSNLVFDEKDKIVSFDAGDSPLEGRIALGDSTALPVAEVGSVTYLSSYITISGDLVIVVEVKSNTDSLSIDSFNATYVAEDGRPTSSSMSDGPMELKSGRVANVAVLFSNVGLGGTLELSFMDAEYNEILVEIPTAK